MSSKHYTMRSTVIVPESVAKLKDGQTLATGTTVRLPQAYGDHLVAERLAKPGKNVDAVDAKKVDADDTETDLDKMTKDELVAEAAKRNVEVKPDALKDEILSALKAAEANA